ncbi:hypothetical protein M404DRAFT_1003874 [Pisolithus tinctorius Marx 270]|uniref:Uncharacterized protein n=1 Tax=Pisolithus tinctorius Marx 270 TaxID=870435 RepID=A0A0C3NHC8_PISTI|nr:hypothetical protein M404DRAFT_1003874 [Pisolithus tinctorius Marx 270]
MRCIKNGASDSHFCPNYGKTISYPIILESREAMKKTCFEICLDKSTDDPFPWPRYLTVVTRLNLDPMAT